MPVEGLSASKAQRPGPSGRDRPAGAEAAKDAGEEASVLDDTGDRGAQVVAAYGQGLATKKIIPAPLNRPNIHAGSRQAANIEVAIPIGNHASGSTVCLAKKLCCSS